MSQPGLGVDLRNARKAAGMSTRSVAGKVGISHASINRTEVGSRKASPDEVIAFCALYGITGRQRERMIDRARGKTTSSPWVRRDQKLGESLARFIELESEASSITEVALNVVPGLVQTPEYARCIIDQINPGQDENEHLVRTRLSRQSLLSQRDAPTVRLLLDEAVLHRQIGGTVVMRDLLDHLLRVGTRPNLTIQVLPLCSGAHPAIDGSFKLMTFPERETYVYIECQGGSVYLTAGDRIEDYQAVIGRVDEHILSPQDSARLIVEVRESMTDE